MENLFTVQEVAEILRIHPNTVYDLKNRANGLRAVRVGHHVRFRPCDLEDYINRQLEAAKAKEDRPGRVHLNYKPGMQIV